MHMQWAAFIARIGCLNQHCAMDELRSIWNEAGAPVVRFSFNAVALALAGLLVMTWCLAVVLFTGRLPWFVRKYL